MRYVLTDEATADLREIITYIRKENPDAAKRVRKKFVAAMERLAICPNIGHRRPDLGDGSLRCWRVYSYLIFYRPDKKPLQIIHVLHGARDIPRFFE